MEQYVIRRERICEQRQVENLIRESFWNVYRPGCLEHYVLHCLREDKDFIPELNLVLTIPDPSSQLGETIIGHAICMKAAIALDRGGELPVMTLGPIGIHPSYQRMGYGKALLDCILDRAAEMGYGAVCFEGNIDFYGKSGFRYASVYGIRYHGLPEGADDSFFLCKELRKGYLDNITGEYSTPRGYFVDEAECEEFDRSFQPKERLRLAGQLW